MKSPIHKGDPLENGGEVTGGSPALQCMGKPVARRGDEARCALHGKTFIAESSVNL